MPDEKLMRNQSDHLIEVTTENGFLNIYIHDPVMGMVHLSKYWGDDFWIAECRQQMMLLSARGDTMMMAMKALIFNFKKWCEMTADERLKARGM